jgi:peptidoglycan DL-endopeptidase CwlO
VASSLLKRSIRGALAATAVAAVGVTSAPAFADPNTVSDAAKQVQDLMHQAEQLTQDVKKAEDDHAAKQVELDRANGDAVHAEQVANQARGGEQAVQGKVDALTNASYQGARMSKLSALLVSQSPSDFLDRASTLDALAKDNNEVITQMSAAVRQAESADTQARDARARAAQAEADAGRIEADLHQKQADMRAQIANAEQRFNQLSAAERASLQTNGQTNYVPSAPASGAAAVAVQAALSKQGAPYVWGATGPNSFDCSGLTMWAYMQAGVTIGRSTYSQVTYGRAVSVSQMQPGDLIFYYSDNSHVAMYVGNGKAVHAPTSGDVVKVTDYQYIGTVNAVRRIVG